MLLSFRVANHKSFREEQELLLLPAYDKSRPAVSVAAVYGANASGKSNLLDALSFMHEAVNESFIFWRPLQGVPRRPFKLAQKSATEESTFGVDLLLGGEKYVYGFSVNDERVTEEWLYHYPLNRRRVLYERVGDRFRFGDSLHGRLGVVEDVTRPNSLFLSAAVQYGLGQLLPIYEWFVEHIEFSDTFDRDYWRLQSAGLAHDRKQKARALRLLKVADLGICNFHVQGENRITFEHQTPGGHSALGLAEESRGTKAWFDLLGVLLEVLDNGRLLLVDELDASLHPLLVREFVRLFQDPETNPHGAQLIFTTHDTSLLARYQGEDLLGRDEIWFTEKDETGATTLYPLTDFKPRTGLNWERRYLGGAVGAVPFLDPGGFADAVGRRGGEGE